jgi:hypothetical protein
MCSRLPLLFILFFAAPLLLHGQKKVATADLRSDLRFLQEAFYRGHPGVFKYNTRDSLDAFFNTLILRQRSDSVPWEQAQVSIRLAVSRLHDGHTSVETPFYDDSTRVIPFTVQVVQDRVYITGNYSGDSTLIKGTEIRKVNDNPVGLVLRLGRLIHTGDGYNTAFQDAIAPLFFARHNTLFFGVQPRNTLLVRLPSGLETTVTVGAIKRADLLQLLQVKSTSPKTNEPKPILKYKDMSLWRDTTSPDLLVLKMGGFPNGRYRRFYNKMFRLMDREKIQHLAIDLRYNTGGNVHNMGYLVGKILDEPFRYQYERQRRTPMGPYFNTKAKWIKAAIWMRYNLTLRMGRARNGDVQIRKWKVPRRKRHNFDGKVYVITNGYSFSSASMCASFLKNRGQALVIGSETGGSETGNCGGGYPVLRLPKTRFKVRFPLFYLRYEVGNIPPGRGVQPHFPVEYSLDDYLQKRDPDMEQLYRLIRT